MISHSKCKKCDAIFNVAKLKDNSQGVGMICAEESECENRQHKTKQNCIAGQPRQSSPVSTA